MEMIGHDHIGIEMHAGIPLWNRLPVCNHHVPSVIQEHSPISNRPKSRLHVVNTDRDQVHARRCVIESRRTKWLSDPIRRW